MYREQICPLTGDWKAKLRERYDVTEIEKVYGGELDLRQRPPCKVLPYKPIPFWELADAAPHVDGETQGHVGVGRMECEVKQGSDADREEAPLTSQGQVGSEDVTTGSSDTSTSEAVLNGLSLVTGGLAPDGVCGASSSSTDRAKCASVGSGRHESEDEFMTPVASPMERPSLDASPICPTTGQQVHDGMADGRALGERSREAIFVGANGKALEDRKGMTRASSELELVAHQKQVLEAAHGGVWDAHSSTERAALMKAAIHSMTEAGLDEEVAQKVFELDSAAVARILSAAASCAQDASPRAASSDELLRVAQEYGLVGNRTPDVVVEATEATTREPAIQPQTPPRDPSHAAPSPSMGVGDERLPPSNELLITDDYLRAIHRSRSSACVCPCQGLGRVSVVSMWSLCHPEDMPRACSCSSTARRARRGAGRRSETWILWMPYTKARAASLRRGGRRRWLPARVLQIVSTTARALRRRQCVRWRRRGVGSAERKREVGGVRMVAMRRRAPLIWCFRSWRF